MRAIHSARNSRFLLAAVAVGVLPRLHHRLLGDAEDVAAAAAEALGLVEDLLVARARRYATFDSWHGRASLSVRQHRADGALVGRVHLRWCRADGACAWWSSW